MASPRDQQLGGASEIPNLRERLHLISSSLDAIGRLTPSDCRVKHERRQTADTKDSSIYSPRPAAGVLDNHTCANCWRALDACRVLVVVLHTSTSTRPGPDVWTSGTLARCQRAAAPSRIRRAFVGRSTPEDPQPLELESSIQSCCPCITGGLGVIHTACCGLPK